MKLDTKSLKLTKDDIDSLHDTIIEALDLDWDKGLTDEEVNTYFTNLPEHIKLDACIYGVCDSVVRDDIYVYLRENR